MIVNEILQGEKVFLRMVELSDCVQYYLDWLNDSEVNKYLETRWHKQSIESITDFVKSVRESSHSYLFAIIYNNKHVGNIKIGPVHPVYNFADISYFIGDKSVWGKGVTTEAIKLICDFAFDKLKLNKICANAHQPNIGSQKVLTKNQFKHEGTKRKQYTLDTPETIKDGGQLYVDVYEYGLLASEYKMR